MDVCDKCLCNSDCVCIKVNWQVALLLIEGLILEGLSSNTVPSDFITTDRTAIRAKTHKHPCIHNTG